MEALNSPNQDFKRSLVTWLLPLSEEEPANKATQNHKCTSSDNYSYKVLLFRFKVRKYMLNLHTMLIKIPVTQHTYTCVQ